MKKDLIGRYLDCRRTAVVESPAVEALHRALCGASGEFYLGLLADREAHVSHRSEVLRNLVQRTQLSAQRILDGLRSLDDDNGLKAVEALRAGRVNSRRARSLVLAFVMGHPRLAELAVSRRGRLIRLLKHALGERVWSAVRRALAIQQPGDETVLQQTVLRYTADKPTAIEALRFLAGVGFPQAEPRPAPVESPVKRRWLVLPWFKGGPDEGKPKEADDMMQSIELQPRNIALRQGLAARRDIEQGEGLPRETLTGLRGTYFPDVPMRRVRELAAIEPRSARTDGPVTASYKQALAGGQTSADNAAVETALSAARLPRVDARVAVVLDLSASMVSSGERLHHPAALGLALTRLVQQSVELAAVHQVGGESEIGPIGIAAPRGETDLAAAVIEAARGEPDAILVVTDGYENVRQGDVSQVVAGLRRLGLASPVYQLIPQFAAAEDVTHRRLGDNVPTLAAHHESGVGEVLARVYLATLADEIGDEELTWLGQLLLGR